FEPPPFHEFLSDLANKNLRLLIQVAREHSKSTLFSVIRPLRKICENRNLRGVIISKTGSAAERFVASVAWQLDNNTQLVADYGRFRPKGRKNWSGGEFTVIRTAAFKEPTL